MTWARVLNSYRNAVSHFETELLRTFSFSFSFCLFPEENSEIESFFYFFYPPLGLGGDKFCDMTLIFLKSQ